MPAVTSVRTRRAFATATSASFVSAACVARAVRSRATRAPDICVYIIE